MTTTARHTLTATDDFRVLSAEGTIGRVEEIWLGSLEEPIAVAVRLVDGRRGLLLASEVAAVSPEDESVTIAPDGRLLQLAPPHLEDAADGAVVAASWRASNTALDLPHPAGRLHDVISWSPGIAPVRALERKRPLWKTLVMVFAALAFIVCTLIGLDILIAYLVTGNPPY
jgi:hypothetical protein